MCTESSRILEAGQISVMCFDKTGTLTEEDLKLFVVESVDHAATDQNASKLLSVSGGDAPRGSSSLKADGFERFGEFCGNRRPGTEDGEGMRVLSRAARDRGSLV